MSTAKQSMCTTQLLDMGTERELGGTHRQHGIKQVSDEGSSALNCLLSLGQVCH